MNKIFTKTIDRLSIGHSATIEKITASSELKSRLLSLGFIKGNTIRVINSSMAKDTLVVSVEDKSRYALRHEEAKCILVSMDHPH